MGKLKDKKFGNLPKDVDYWKDDYLDDDYQIKQWEKKQKRKKSRDYEDDTNEY